LRQPKKLSIESHPADELTHRPPNVIASAQRAAIHLRSPRTRISVLCASEHNPVMPAQAGIPKNHMSAKQTPQAAPRHSRARPGPPTRSYSRRFFIPEI
jgi:hypothetical protein